MILSTISPTHAIKYPWHRSRDHRPYQGGKKLSIDDVNFFFSVPQV